MTEPPSPESSEPDLSALLAIAADLADCVDRLDAAGFPVEANHVDHGRALIALRLRRGLIDAEARRVNDAMNLLAR